MSKKTKSGRMGQMRAENATLRKKYEEAVRAVLWHRKRHQVEKAALERKLEVLLKRSEALLSAAAVQYGDGVLRLKKDFIPEGKLYVGKDGEEVILRYEVPEHPGEQGDDAVFQPERSGAV